MTDIKVFPLTLNNGSCPLGYEAIFTKPWDGMDRSCNCIQEQIDSNNANLNTPIDFSTYIRFEDSCSDSCEQI